MVRSTDLEQACAILDAMEAGEPGSDGPDGDEVGE